MIKAEFTPMIRARLDIDELDKEDIEKLLVMTFKRIKDKQETFGAISHSLDFTCSNWEENIYPYFVIKDIIRRDEGKDWQKYRVNFEKVDDVECYANIQCFGDSNVSVNIIYHKGINNYPLGNIIYDCFDLINSDCEVETLYNNVCSCSKNFSVL